MSHPTLPPEVRALIRGPLATIAHVEALLLLRRVAPAAPSVEQVAAEAQVPTLAVARRYLDELVVAGLVEAATTDAYRYAPTTAEGRAAVDALARTYDERPVTLVRAVYARPVDAMDALADAFRLRPDGDRA
jgi:hypothetical protein